MTKTKGKLIHSCAVVALCTMAFPALAQSPSEPAAAPPAPAEAGEDHSVLIVTGSARPKRRFDVSYDVSALSKAEVKTLAPRSFGELLANVPGIQTEPSGGEVGSITRNRGIPTDDGGVLFQQDGLSLFQDVNSNSFRGDALNRHDLMTSTVEVVRGGPAPIFASQASALVNNITVTGGPVAKSQVQVTAGTTGLLRFDAVTSGPVAEDTYFAIGGFIRRDDGPRDGGFPNDQGGQLRANIKHNFDDGSSIKISGTYVNDHNVFLLPIPITNPANGQSLDQYIDYFTGTFNTPALSSSTIKYVDGAGQTQTQNVNLDSGRHTKFTNFGVTYNSEFHGWDFAARAGYTQGSVTLNGLFSSNNPADANTFVTSSAAYSIGGRSALAAAQNAYGTQVTSVGYAIGGTNGTQLYDPYSQSGLVVVSQYQYRDIGFRSAQGDFSLTREFETGLGTHDVRVGVYGAAWGLTNFQVFQNFLTELKGQPRLLDLVALNSAGAKVGMVTNNGMTTNSTSLQRGEADATMVAFYINDSWQVTEDLRIDAGYRHENYFSEGWSQVTAPTNITTPNTLVTSARAFTGALSFNKVKPVVDNWTIGVNYNVSSNIGAYVRASHLDTPPVLSNLYAVQTPGVTNLALSSTHSNQYEIGLKTSWGKSFLYVIGYLTEFDPLTVQYQPVNQSTGATGNITTLLAKARDSGIEVDGSLHLFGGLNVSFNATVAEPEYLSLVDAAGTTYPVVVGKQIIRQPKVHYSIRPQYKFTRGDNEVLIYARYNFMGNRFVDIANTTALPEFGEYSAGVTVKMPNGWDLQLVGNNLTNAKGLTEGNPRLDVLSGQGTPVASYGRPIFGRSARLILSKSW